jgi:ABC-type transporter Mla subunit MlaD
MSEKVLFRWACLAVVAAALAALGWMLNDMRLQVRELAESANRQLNEVQGLTTKANTILAQTERVTKQLDDKVPQILVQTERVTGSMDQHLPKILAESEAAVGSLANLGANFRQYKDLMAKVHANQQDAKLLNYGNKLLDLVGWPPSWA